MRYLRCPLCGAANEKKQRECRRCGQNIVLDERRSLHRATAFLLAALILFIPANFFPILQTAKFASTSASTIIQGVVELYESGDVPIAVVIFIASIMVPLIKFVILIYLLVSIRWRRCKNVSQKIKLYYLIEITGPWSLIDVFVVIILVALIHFKNISIIPGAGATSFAMMVFLTILASNSLDVRLLGEICEKR